MVPDDLLRWRPVVGNTSVPTFASVRSARNHLDLLLSD
jgi:hypothetical protein